MAILSPPVVPGSKLNVGALCFLIVFGSDQGESHLASQDKKMPRRVQAPAKSPLTGKVSGLTPICDSRVTRATSANWRQLGEPPRPMFLHEGPYLVGDHSEQPDVLKLELGELICVRIP